MLHSSPRAPSASTLVPAPRRFRRGMLVAVAALAATTLGMTCENNHEPVGHQSFTSPQVNPIVAAPDGSRIFVANTTSNTVEIIEPGESRIPVGVGVEPVSLALRPGGTELWVSNHVSDSVSVVDVDPESPTFLTVIETIQDVDGDGVSRFDEPAGIAFASDQKAYVALSSRNDVAVVDANTYQVTGRIHITAQDPRAIAVRDGRLYVAAFESSNQSELAVCPEEPPIAGTQCSLDLADLGTFVLASPNIPGEPVEIVRDPDVPDRDLFVFDTADDSLLDVVEGVGTLLYGLAVDSTGRAFVSLTEARNEVNGQFGQNLVDLDNRMFLNQVARVDCGGAGCGAPTILDLEPPPPAQPARSDALATPYGIAVSEDDSIVVGTAMGTSRIFTLDAGSGAVLDVLDLNDGAAADFGQQIPKGVALVSDAEGAPQTAYVLNSLENTVSVVDVSDPSALVHLEKFAVGLDPTPEPVRRGRIAFANAFASDSATFSCESCHPDNHTDQLLWRIGGACFFGDCTGDDEVRSTMPVKGLRNTLPLHWDGTLGDPFGGPNGAIGNGGSEPPSCTLGDADGDHDCFRDLVDASLSGVMCDQVGGCAAGPSGLPGRLDEQAREDMATFLAAPVYPPARSRAADDTVSSQALDGFEDFFVDVSGPNDLGDVLGVTTCADMDSGCHALPLGVDHNSATLGGFDAPTMRGMTDRFLHFSAGITTAEEVLAFGSEPQQVDLGGIILDYPGPPPELVWDPAEGYEEDVSFQTAFIAFQPIYGAGALDMFQMFEEASTGFSGAVARQVQLNARTTSPGQISTTDTLLAALELADEKGSVNLRGRGRRNGHFDLLSYREDGTYKNRNDSVSLTRAELLAKAQDGTLTMVFTAELRENFGKETHRQPLISVNTTGSRHGTNPAIPLLPAENPMLLEAIDVRGDAAVFWDGEPIEATLSCVGGSFTPFCDSQALEIDLAAVPSGDGLHLLQVQNPGAGLSAELPVCVGASIAPCQN